MCRQTPIEDSGPGASCCAPAKHYILISIPSLAVTGGEHTMPSKHREYMEDVPGQNILRQQRMRTMEQDRADVLYNIAACPSSTADT